MKDRAASLPNRRKITYADGRVEYVTIEYADAPTEVGTLLNKDNLLSDAAVSSLELPQEDPVPSDALLALKMGAIQYSTMPIASEDNLGYLAVFIGETDTYASGSIYRCESSGGESPTYSWVKSAIGIVPADISAEPSRLQFIDTVVDKDDFVADETYEDFPFRATVPLDDVLADMVPHVVFGVADAISGAYSPVAACYAGGVYLYASEVPAADITVPTIICWR